MKIYSLWVGISISSVSQIFFSVFVFAFQTKVVMAETHLGFLSFEINYGTYHQEHWKILRNKTETSKMIIPFTGWLFLFGPISNLFYFQKRKKIDKLNNLFSY